MLVNNAGVGLLASVEQTGDADLRRVMDVNFFGVWNTTKAVLPPMRARGADGPADHYDAVLQKYAAASEEVFARLLVKPKLADPTGEAVVAAFAARLGG